MDRQGIIVGIHGLENKPPLDEKRRWWKAAIVEGLQRNCRFDGEALDFEFVYWADLRYDRPLGEDENKEPYEPDEGSAPFPRHAPASETSLNDTVLSRIYRGLDWVQTKTGVTPVDDAILQTRFDDLWHYHSETAFARQVRGRLCDVLERLAGERILLVAHSMGSIIAYDALRMLERDAPSVRVEHFVTLGSPLGLAEVKLKVVAENGAARTPNNVGRWTNLADKQDLAAVVGELAEDYVPNDHGVAIRDVGVVNDYRRPDGSSNHHKSYGYLRTPEFSEIARDFADACADRTAEGRAGASFVPRPVAPVRRRVYPLAMTDPIHIIGGGLAGSEAAWQIAQSGHAVVIHEMRPVRGTEAHHGQDLAELVCSNSFRSDDANGNAVGLLHQEMRTLGSLILRSGDAHQVPAGGALAVDREGFARSVTAALEAHPLVTIAREEVDGLPPAAWGQVIVATGPLTSPALAEAIRGLTGSDALAFFDAIAPIVHRDSIDMGSAWFQSRYDKVGPGGTGADYINCPMNREQYDAFIQALIQGDKIGFKEWEASTPYFDGCLPIEIMAERGPETLRHGPMKPVGLTNPHDPTVKACAIVQLRQDNALGTLYNMVGFQTKLTYTEQVRVFRTIPGLENAEFARLGGLHRNTYLDSPRLLDATLRLKAEPRMRFAGQITGCEGYVESAATGLMAGRFAVAEIEGRTLPPLPATTALGALIGHITGGHIGVEEAGSPRSFQPMNVNFGLFPPLAEAPRGEAGKRLRGPEKAVAKKRAMTDRARADLATWIAETSVTARVAAE